MWRVGSYLLVWMGLSFAAPLLLVPLIVAQRSLSRLPSPPLPLLQLAVQVGVGLLLLWAARWCWLCSGGDPFWFRSFWRGFLRGACAIFAPRADDFLHQWTLRIPLSPIELQQQLEREAPVVARWRAWWIGCNGESQAVTAVIKGSRVVFKAGRNSFWHSWHGHWETNTSGTVLQGCLQMSWLERVQWGLVAGFVCLFQLLGLGAGLAQGTSGLDSLLFCAFNVLMWAALLLFFRLNRFFARQQERQLETFWRERLGAEIERVPRQPFWPWF